MKHLLFIFCLFVLAVTTASAQQFYEDVVYLKNGSIIRGVIVEQIPNESLKIRIQGGSVMIFPMSDVLKITKELPSTQELPSVQLVFPERKSPILAFVLSFLIIGTGQAYVEEIDQAIAHWAITAGSILLLAHDDPAYNDLGLAFGLTNWIVSMITAPISAEAFNNRNRHRQRVSLITERLMLEPYTSHETTGAMLSFRF